METQPLGDEPKDESPEVYMVLGLEVMGHMRCADLGSSAYRVYVWEMLPEKKEVIQEVLVRRESEKL